MELLLGIRFMLPFGIFSVPLAMPVSFSVRQTEGWAAPVAGTLYTDAVTRQPPLETWMFSIWAAGFTCLIIFKAVQYIQLACFVKNARTEKEETAVCHIPVCSSDKIMEPFVFGILHPLICLPKGLCEAHKQMILRHECTHVRRRDILKKEFYLLLCCLYWYNPAIWIWKRYACLDLEMACDEAATESMQPAQRKNYAVLLLSRNGTEEKMRAHTALFSGNIRQRIEGLFYIRKKQHRRIVTCVAVGFLLLTMLQPVYAEGRDYKVFDLRCPSCGDDTLTKTVRYGSEQKSGVQPCRHFAYGTDQTGIFDRTSEEICGNCNYEKREEALSCEIVTECRGYRSSEVIKEASDLIIKSDILKEPDTICGICGQKKSIRISVLPAICLGSSRVCIHGKTGNDEEVGAPAMATLCCSSCGSRKYEFLKQYQTGWVCKGYS
ncbi:MAG: M56 family metallopeptidase [Eubacteriales bacterium]|nr:M56 family metallopeptidase [Eubacteriales bacterium]